MTIVSLTQEEATNELGAIAFAKGCTIQDGWRVDNENHFHCIYV